MIIELPDDDFEFPNAAPHDDFELPNDDCKKPRRGQAGVPERLLDFKHRSDYFCCASGTLNNVSQHPPTCTPPAAFHERE